MFYLIIMYFADHKSALVVLRGENVGKGLTKSPSQIPERAIKVIRD